MGLNMKVNGRMISRMDMEWRHGQMGQGMRGCTKMERNMGRGLIYGVMGLSILESGLTIK